jgi:hypothetical protein
LKAIAFFSLLVNVIFFPLAFYSSSSTIDCVDVFDTLSSYMSYLDLPLALIILLDKSSQFGLAISLAYVLWMVPN